MEDKLAWILEPNEKVWEAQAQKREQKIVAKYGPRCNKCGWPINHPIVQEVPHPGQTHDCFTGDPLAR